MDVSEAKDKVDQKYKQYIDSGTFRLQHVSENYVEVVKLSAHQKIVFLKEHVESVRRSFSLHAIEVIVHEAAGRALTYENIKDVCRHAYISGIGNVESDFLHNSLNLYFKQNHCRIKGQNKGVYYKAFRERNFFRNEETY